ncbi:beta-ketoacyl-[acyl-carrier-protein] synthase family protein [Tenacibaculum halocynthiae]|uniref:beta-ketoacyl-[acyl-carrier-protein] synthase family protein n=1 Tax=Tenacibaculum halocynthiae TaxID=1254437 RepID=UPI00389317A2
MRNVYASYTNIISPLGFTTQENVNNILQKKSGIKRWENTKIFDEPYYASQLNEKKVDEEFSKLSETVNEYTKLEKMMILSLSNVVNKTKDIRLGKIGVIISTTKGNIDALDKENKFSPKRAYLPKLGETIKSFFGFKEDPIIVSNACISGLLAVIMAKRFIQSSIYDTIFIVSGDIISEFTLSGFNSFKAISNAPCKPFSKNRNGVTLGEAAAAIVITAEKEGVQIIGEASSNDANHISGPSRTGEGLFRSIKKAKQESKKYIEKIDYISAHGTATLFNDEMEAIAFNRMNLDEIPVNSFKGYYGHTLGASGLLETILGIESMKTDTLFPSLGFDELGASKAINVIKDTKKHKINAFLKTASGFGGCNAAAIFKK